MRQFNKFKGTKGFLSLYESALKWRNMRKQEEVTRRARALTFWQTHGLKATMDAFGVSKRTLCRWKSALKKERGKLTALDPKSTAPKNRRRRVYDSDYIAQVIHIRNRYGRVGKKKLANMCNVSESYAGRTITDLKKRGLLRQNHKLSFYARTGNFHERKTTKTKRKRRANKRGMEIDTIVRFINGTKRYIFTAIDVERRFAFAGAYASHSSISAKDFLQKLITVSPFPITEIQTDNGSEFANCFHDACDEIDIAHYHTYPKCPKMNAHIERFNRTISEGFIMPNRMLLATDLQSFNEQMVDWLLWYNGERPHQSLGMLSPLQFIVKEMGLSERKCHKWWTST